MALCNEAQDAARDVCHVRLAERLLPFQVLQYRAPRAQLHDHVNVAVVLEHILRNFADGLIIITEGCTTLQGRFGDSAVQHTQSSVVLLFALLKHSVVAETWTPSRFAGAGTQRCTFPQLLHGVHSLLQLEQVSRR